jgi:hypothetical protein
LVLELAGQFTVNGKPTLTFISYISFDQKNVALEECSISEIIYAYSHKPNFIYGELDYYVPHVNSICQFIQSMLISFVMRA